MNGAALLTDTVKNHPTGPAIRLPDKVVSTVSGAAHVTGSTTSGCRHHLEYDGDSHEDVTEVASEVAVMILATGVMCFVAGVLFTLGLMFWMSEP